MDFSFDTIIIPIALLGAYWLGYVFSLNAPTENETASDANANVVRCKDCKWRFDSKHCTMTFPDNSLYCPDIDWTEDEGYCHKGELKTGGNENAAD